MSWGVSRWEYWSGLPCPPPGDLPNPGIEPRSPALQVDSLPSEPPGKPKNTEVGSLSLLQGIFLTQESNQVFCIAGAFFTSWATRQPGILFSFSIKITISGISLEKNHQDRITHTHTHIHNLGYGQAWNWHPKWASRKNHQGRINTHTLSVCLSRVQTSLELTSQMSFHKKAQDKTRSSA